MSRPVCCLLLGMAWNCRSPTSGSHVPCQQQSPNVARLETFVAAEMGKPYWVDVNFSEQEWQPAPSIRPEYHHASRLEFDNVEEFPLLAGRQASPLRLTFELRSTEVSKSTTHDPWRSVYRARILRVCEPQRLEPRVPASATR
jgi:hypothetical protein